MTLAFKWFIVALLFCFVIITQVHIQEYQFKPHYLIKKYDIGFERRLDNPLLYPVVSRYESTKFIDGKLHYHFTIQFQSYFIYSLDCVINGDMLATCDIGVFGIYHFTRYNEQFNFNWSDYA